MELEFIKSEVPYLKTMVSETQLQEQTQEVRIADGMPDIGRVLCGWGQVLVRGKQWRTGSVGVNGGVLAWVLYMPENGTQMQCVETWLPFQMKWDVDSSVQNGSIVVLPFLRCVDARLVSARKLLVRTEVGVSVQARCAEHIDTYIPGDLPDGLCVKEKVYPATFPREVGEKAFTVTEKTEGAALEKIVYYTITPQVTEQRFIGDKLLFRGSALLHILALSTDGALVTRDLELPFSQYCEVTGEYDENDRCQILFAVTDLELQKDTTGDLTLKAGLLAQLVICSHTLLQTVEDAYSTRKEAEPQIRMLNMPAILDTVTETVPVKHHIQLDGRQVIDSTFYPDVPGLYRDDEGITAALSGQISALVKDFEGQIQCVQERWEGEQNIPADNGVGVEVGVIPDGVQVVSADGEFSTQMEMRLQFQNENQIPVITGVSLGEDKMRDPQRPNLILCRTGERSLWDIAKIIGSTEEAIKKANGLTDEPERDRMLLIPVE